MNNQHRMQFNDGGPDWCIDCGRFCFACPGVDCPSPGSGAFDSETAAGAENIAGCLFDTFLPESGTSEAP